MASWTHWFWVTTSAFIIVEWLLGRVVTADSLLVGPVRADQVRNFPEVWRQARGGFPVTIPVRGHSLMEAKVKQNVTKSRLESRLLDENIPESGYLPNLKMERVSELDYQSSLKRGKVSELGHHPGFKEGNVPELTHHSSLKGGKVAELDHNPVLKGEEVSELGHHPVLKEGKVSELEHHPGMKEEKVTELGHNPVVNVKEVSELGHHTGLKQEKVSELDHHPSLMEEKVSIHQASLKEGKISELVDHSSLKEKEVSELGDDPSPLESQVIKAVSGTKLKGEKGIKPRYYPISVKVNISEHNPKPSLVEDIIIEPIDESRSVTRKVDQDSHLKNNLTNPHLYLGLLNGKGNKPGHHAPLLTQTVTEHIPEQHLPVTHEPIKLVFKHTENHKLVAHNNTFSTRSEEILPGTHNEAFNGERIALGTPEQVLAIKLLEDKTLENNTSFVKQAEKLYDKVSDNVEHKSSEEHTKVTLEGTRWSVEDTKLENDSKVSASEVSNRTIRPRHYKHKFSQAESQSDSQVTSAETGGMQQIYYQQNTPNQVRVKKLDIDITNTGNRSGDLLMDTAVNKRQFGKIDTETHIDEQAAISDKNNSSGSYEEKFNKYVPKNNETFDDVYSFDPVEMQPTEPSIEEEMNKFIRIFRKDQNDPIKIHNVRSETSSKEVGLNFPTEKAKAHDNDAKTHVNIPLVEARLQRDNATSFSSANLAKLKSLAHVKTGGRDKNLQTKLDPSAEDSGLNSSRAGKAINRRPVLIQVKPEDISIIFSKSFRQEGRSPYQTKDLKDQKVSSRELNKVKEHIIAKTVTMEEKEPQKDTLITHNQHDKSLPNQVHKDENASLENSENNGLKNMLNMHLENMGLLNGGDESRQKHIKVLTESNDSSHQNASVPAAEEGHIDQLMRDSLLPYLSKSRTTYPPLKTSLKELEVNMRRSGLNIGDDIYHQGILRGKHIENDHILHGDSLLDGPDTLAMTRKEQDVDSYEGANNSDKDIRNEMFGDQDNPNDAIATNEMFGDDENPHDAIASASFVDFVSPTDNQSMESPHIRIEVEGRAVTKRFLDVTNIVAVALGTVVFIMIVTVVSAAVLYRRRFLLKPHSLDDCYTNSESGSSCWTEQDIFQTVSYEDCQGMDLPRDNSEEMFNLDNDSFLNSLEAMTIPEYWNESVRHTKL